MLNTSQLRDITKLGAEALFIIFGATDYGNTKEALQFSGRCSDAKKKILSSMPF